MGSVDKGRNFASFGRNNRPNVGNRIGSGGGLDKFDRALDRMADLSRKGVSVSDDELAIEMALADLRPTIDDMMTRAVDLSSGVEDALTADRAEEFLASGITRLKFVRAGGLIAVRDASSSYHRALYASMHKGVIGQDLAIDIPEGVTHIDIDGEPDENGAFPAVAISDAGFLDLLGPDEEGVTDVVVSGRSSALEMRGSRAKQRRILRATTAVIVERTLGNTYPTVWSTE